MRLLREGVVNDGVGSRPTAAAGLPRRPENRLAQAVVIKDKSYRVKIRPRVPSHILGLVIAGAILAFVIVHVLATAPDMRPRESEGVNELER